MRLSATSSSATGGHVQLGAAPAPPAQIVTNGLMLHLDASDVNSFNPNAANPTWNDISKANSTLNGTLVSGTNYSSLHGGYLQFDGVDDYVQFPVTTDFQTLDLPFTVSLFLRFNGYNGSMIDFREGNNWEGFSDFNYNDNGLTVGTWSKSIGNYYTSNFRLSIGTWYHICYVRNGTNFTCYLNGVVDQSITITSWKSWSKTLRLGSSIQNSAFHGGIGTVLYYKNKALTQAEVQQNHNACMPRFLT